MRLFPHRDFEILEEGLKVLFLFFIPRFDTDEFSHAHRAFAIWRGVAGIEIARDQKS